VTTPDQFASVRYLVNDVQAAIDFYTTHLGFTLHSHPAPAFADVTRGPLRLLLSGPASSGARATPSGLGSGGNRIHPVRAKRSPPLALLAVPGEPEHLGDRGLQVVVTDLSGSRNSLNLLYLVYECTKYRTPLTRGYFF